MNIRTLSSIYVIIKDYIYFSYLLMSSLLIFQHDYYDDALIDNECKKI